MISKQHYIAKLRELGYTHDKQLHYQDRWRKRGGTHIVHIARRDWFESETVSNQLRQCGATSDDIDKFMAECHVTTPTPKKKKK